MQNIMEITYDSKHLHFLVHMKGLVQITEIRPQIMIAPAFLIGQASYRVMNATVIQ